MAESEVSLIRDLPVILPDGRLLGTVHDTVIETESWNCTHIFVADPPADLVEGRNPRCGSLELGAFGRRCSGLTLVPSHSNS